MPFEQPREWSLKKQAEENLTELAKTGKSPSERPSKMPGMRIPLSEAEKAALQQPSLAEQIHAQQEAAKRQKRERPSQDQAA